MEVTDVSVTSLTCRGKCICKYNISDMSGKVTLVSVTSLAVMGSDSCKCNIINMPDTTDTSKYN